jgi:hypothetical protein
MARATTSVPALTIGQPSPSPAAPPAASASPKVEVTPVSTLMTENPIAKLENAPSRLRSSCAYPKRASSRSSRSTTPQSVNEASSAWPALM